MIVTTTIVRDIRRRRAEGEKLASIAAALGVSYDTAWKYASDSNLATRNEIDRRDWERVKADPERLARRREAARRCMERKRAG